MTEGDGEKTCPECGRPGVVPIVYGMPSHDTFLASERGEVIIGGCVLSGEDPDHGCPSCGARFRLATRR